MQKSNNTKLQNYTNEGALNKFYVYMSTHRWNQSFPECYKRLSIYPFKKHSFQENRITKIPKLRHKLYLSFTATGTPPVALSSLT